MRRLAYLVNTYPSPTHTFIRREIEALEAQGMTVERFALRRPANAVLASNDSERAKVRAVLDIGRVQLVLHTLRLAAARPGPFLATVVAAIRLARGSHSGLGRHVAYLAEACVLVRWWADASIDHVHVHFGTNAVTVAQLVKRLGGPGYSFTVHGPEEFDRPRELKLHEKVADARFTVAISSFGRSQVMRWSAPEDWDRVHVVHCAVDHTYLERAITPVPDVPRLISIGRLAPQKGQVLLVEAVARLHDEGTPVELVIVGDGEMRDNVGAAIAEHGLEDIVQLAGWLDNEDVAAEIAASRGVVLPSFAEGLPVVLMEALAMGRPVVTTAIAGIPELVHPGETGWIVPAGSIDELVDAMRELLSTSVDELNRMGKAGAAIVAADHDAIVEAAKLRTLFDEAV